MAAAGRNDVIGRRKLIGALRNSIHEEPLHGFSHARNSGSAQHARNVDIQPEAFVEAMMRHTIEDIDRQMAATDVGRVAVGKHDPPADDDPKFGAVAAFSVLALTGLAELGARFEASLHAQG